MSSEDAEATDDRAAVAEQLRRVPMFSTCADEDLLALAAVAKPLAIEASTEIVHEGTGDTNRFFVITAGQAKVSKRMRKVAELGAGDFFGELALLVDRPRSCTVLALTDLDVLTLDRRDFRAALERVPTLGLRIAEALATRLTDLEDDLV